MYVLKQVPEDFLVTEISNVPFQSSGAYLYYKLVKKNWNTLDAVKRIAETAKIKEKQIGFAGSKDRNAITEQVISFAGVSKERIDAVQLNEIELRFLGYGSKPISLGDLQGNQFEIIVRNLEESFPEKIKQIPNYFDEQRFGLHNVNVGRHLVKKQFDKAVSCINSPHYREHLKEHQNDFIGALKKLPLRLLRFYINAYQSYLWNETLAIYLKDHGKLLKKAPYSLGEFIFVKNAEEFVKLKIPLIGFGSEELEGEEVRDIIAYLMKKENLSYDDFVIKQIPELTLEGELRKAFVEVEELKIGPAEEDEFHSGKKKRRLSFSLPKGSYATMVVKRMF